MSKTTSTIAAETETTSTTDTDTATSTVTDTVESTVSLSPRDEMRALAAQIPELEAAAEEVKRHKDFQFANAIRIRSIATEESDSYRDVRAAEWAATLARNARAELLSGAPAPEQERLEQLRKNLSIATMGPENRGPLIAQLERSIETIEARLDAKHHKSSEHLHARDDLARAHETLDRARADIAQAQAAVDQQIERMIAS